MTRRAADLGDLGDRATPTPQAAPVHRARRPPGAAAPARDRARLASLAVHAGLAALVTVPLLLTKTGQVGADTKQYLYVDPAKLLSRAWSMWDPNTGLGTVTHQNIGYLFPMGPWYWALERLGVPDWVAQRLWLAAVLFAAGAGMLFLARTMAWRGAGPVVAALVYALSPYTLDYAARISAILLPFAALPWMVGIAMRALRRGGWRWPALFALVALVVGGVNATALLLAGVGPLLWFPFAVWVEREATWRDAAGTMLRIGGLTAGVSLWWVVALGVQGRYGLPVLDFSETLDAVAVTSVTIEVVRGLGYWFFYGSDKLGPWIEASVAYTQRLALLAVTYLLPILAVAGSFLTRFRHRAYFVALVLVGTVVAVGAHPFDAPSPLGAVYKSFASSSTVGLALRSTARAVPLVVLGFAVLLGTAVTAVGRRARVPGTVAAVLVAALAVGANPALFAGQFVDENLMRDEELPAYWREAAAWLDERDDGTRVLELPGIDFAAYRWGNTVDPVTPGLMDRPYVARELIAFLGSAAAADLLIALDRRFQEGIAEPEAIAPVARLLGVGDVVLRSDLQFERYRTPRPRALWDLLTPAPDGLGEPVPFGEPVPNVADPRLPLVDELALATPPSAPHPPPVAAFPVEDAVPIVRTHPAAAPLVVAGDGEGVVDAAAEGLLDGEQALLYAASLDDAAVAAAVEAGAELVVTDTNRRRARRWRTVRENAGYTERAGEEPAVDDLADARLDVFPGADDDDRTVAVTTGADVSATSYGNPVSLTADNRPVLALDGDPDTAWETAAFADAAGERLIVLPDEPVTTDHLSLLQPVRGARNRSLTEVRLHFDDGGEPVDVVLGPESRAVPGQVVGFAPRTFSRLEIELVATDRGELADYTGISGVGFAEVGIPGLDVAELIRLPVDLLDRAGAASDGNRLTLLMTRQRSNPGEPVRSDEEPAMNRVFELPTARSFTLAGAARLSAHAPDDVLDELLGAGGGLVARSSGRLPGDVGARSAAALDGDPATHWSPGFLDQEGHWIEVTAPEPVTFDSLDLLLVADGRHSVPTRLRVDAGGESRVVDVPPVQDRAGEEDAVVAAPVSFPELTGATVRVTVEAVRPATTIDYYTLEPIEMPVGVAELGLAGLTEPLPTGPVPGDCRTGLLTVDGEDVGVRLVGHATEAAERGRLDVEACDGALDLDAGTHVVRAAKGGGTGVDLDRLVLASDPGGAAATVGPDGRVGPGPAPATPSRPTVEVLEDGRTSVRVRVTGATESTWLVLGQSRNEGWTAAVDGGPSLGGSSLVDGFANGWLLPGSADGAPVEVTMTWGPQRAVWAGLVASLLAVLACVALAVVDPRRLGGRRAGGPAAGPDLAPELVSPLHASGRRPRRAVRVGAALAAAAVAAVVAAPLAAVPVGVAALLALSHPRGRAVLALGAVGCLGLAALYVIVQQYRWQFPSDFAWPKNFDRIHVLAWVGVLLFATDALVDRLRGPDG